MIQNNLFMRNTYFYYFLAVYCVLLFINAIFPIQSDDLGAGYQGFQGAYNSYMHWNGRFGELMRVAFGSYFGETIYFPFVNALLGTYFIFCIFFIFMGRLPKDRVDLCIFLIIVFMIMYHVTFGSIFIWVCGAFNYLWGYCFIVTWLLPYRFFWSGYIGGGGGGGGNTLVKNSPLLYLFITVIGFFAGWSGEFGIVLFMLQCIFIAYAKYSRLKLPLWYYIGVIALLAGWIVLYVSPGSATRMNLAVEHGDAYALSQIFHMSFIEKILRINDIFKTHTLFFALAIIGMHGIYMVNTHKAVKVKTLYFLLGAGVIIGFKEANNLLFMLASVLMCLYIGYRYRRDNKTLESKIFFVMSGLFATYMLHNLALIQLGTLSGRAQLHYDILRMSMISTIFFYFAKRYNIDKRGFYILNIICVFYATFVVWAYVDMSFKWHNMLGFIDGQKLAGEKHIVIDRNTFHSFYRKYGDWSNPADDPSEWPNTSYADYFGVDSFTVR